MDRVLRCRLAEGRISSDEKMLPEWLGFAAPTEAEGPTPGVETGITVDLKNPGQVDENGNFTRKHTYY